MTPTTADATPVMAGVRAAVPVAVGYVGIGFAAGVIGAQAGLSPAEITLLSLLLFAGSAQFVFAELYAGSALALITTVFLVNIRHLLYSLAFAPRVRGQGMGARCWIGAQLTDETFSLGMSLLHGPLRDPRWMIALNMTAYLAWIGGNLSGALAGQAAAAVNGLGLDFALAAMFAALLMLQVVGAARGVRAAVAAVGGFAALVYVALELWQAHPLNLLVATVVAATAGVLLGPRVEIQQIEEVGRP